MERDEQSSTKGIRGVQRAPGSGSFMGNTLESRNICFRLGDAGEIAWGSYDSGFPQGEIHEDCKSLNVASMNGNKTMSP